MWHSLGEGSHMPKVRGDEVAEALEELEAERERDFDDGWDGGWNTADADFEADDVGNVKALYTRADNNDYVDPRIWPMMMVLLRALPKDESSDDLPQIV